MRLQRETVNIIDTVLQVAIIMKCNFDFEKKCHNLLAGKGFYSYG